MKTAIRTALAASAVIGCLLFADSSLGTKAFAASETKQATIHVNGNALQFTDIIPIIDENQNMYVPVRSFAEQMGYSLSWSAVNSSVNNIEISNGTTTVRFRSDSASADVNGDTINMGGNPWVYKDNTYIPFRFLMNSFDLDFVWTPDYLNSIPRIDRSPQKKVAATSSAQSVASRIINTGRSYLGVPYVWGGTSPSGFDCSGYIQYIYRKHGVSLPRTSREMYSAGYRVSNPIPGDLVFFASNGSTISHVGVYIGNNQYLNASSGKAYQVVVTSMSSAWSKRTYVGAKRVL
ncbi:MULTISPECIES: NlpC/P60 family protein [Paenibacillus]|uniref:Cell wall lytic activity n=1 Tax=Paenibacillus alvei TaxID=44250 RepID=A0AAP6ZVQ2_PAEAL|nr:MULTISPECIES: NlpC/P60 family protein [Paenibacillus]MCY7485145.1 NlpC/P60 family protein [Paenibacillus alvei]NOJ70586.1 cell wall lytic activity [Paenibacillus alvei]